MTARWQKTSEAVKTISAEKVCIKIYLFTIVASVIKILFVKIFLDVLDPESWLSLLLYFRISDHLSLPSQFLTMFQSLVTTLLHHHPRR